MRITSKFESGQFDKKTSNATFIKGRIAIANQYLMEMEQFTPKRSGELRAAGHVVGTGESIRYNLVYARAHFYGTNGIVTFRNYTTAGTGKRWDIPGKENIGAMKAKAMKAMGY